MAAGLQCRHETHESSPTGELNVADLVTLLAEFG